MNHSSTKAMVEFLHGYLNFLTRFQEIIDVKDNIQCVGFVCENLNNPLTQRDILTQSAIIYWMMVRRSLKGKTYDQY